MQSSEQRSVWGRSWEAGSGAAGEQRRPCRPRHAHRQAHQDSGRATGAQGASSQREIGNLSSNIEQIALINIQRYKRISQSYPHSERGRNRSLPPRALWGPRWRRRRPALTPHDFATREASSPDQAQLSAQGSQHAGPGRSAVPPPSRPSRTASPPDLRAQVAHGLVAQSQDRSLVCVCLCFLFSHQ